MINNAITCPNFTLIILKKFLNFKKFKICFISEYRKTFALFFSSFTAVFSKHSTYKGIKSVEFAVPHEEFNTISNKYIGFRYRNLEKIKYFPEWNPCSK